MIELRDYQRAASDAAVAALSAGQRPLLAMPTGTGKTIVFADVCARRREAGRSLVLVPRIELADQALDKIRGMTSLTCGIEMAERRVDKSALPDVTIASVQTMARPNRRAAFARDAFGTIVIDEAHHAASPSYADVLDHFEGAACVGVTATPDRGDGIGLDDVFTDVAYSYELTDAILDKWLAPITAKIVHLRDLDLSGVRTTAGDLNEGQLARAVDPLLQTIANGVLEFRGDRPTVVFCVTVDHATRLAAMLCARAGAQIARHVDGGMGKSERAGILDSFQRGELPILCNVAVLTEGWDAPRCACIALARPTKSRALYTQMIGRGTRLFPGKSDLLLLDFVGNAGRHSLVGPLDLMGIEVHAGARGDVDAALAGDGLGLIDGVEAANQRAREAVERLAKARAEARKVDPFRPPAPPPHPWVAPPFAHGGPGAANVPNGTRSWRGRGAWREQPPTEKQLAMLERNGIAVPGLTRGQASERLDRIFARIDAGLCTFKQAKVLQRYGLPTEDTTMAKAGEWLDAIASNGWRMPAALRAAATEME